jgi:chromosome segregation ATPase
MSTSWTYASKFSKEGLVFRLTMKKFMIYNHETIWPGPNFNVTVGPNGSGKSTIVTALSVSLGGDISSLHRQADVLSLVNHVAEPDMEALVEHS